MKIYNLVTLFMSHIIHHTAVDVFHTTEHHLEDLTDNDNILSKENPVELCYFSTDVSWLMVQVNYNAEYEPALLFCVSHNDCLSLHL